LTASAAAATSAAVSRARAAAWGDSNCTTMRHVDGSRVRSCVSTWQCCC
jgi:hypothetical protein